MEKSTRHEQADETANKLREDHGASDKGKSRLAKECKDEQNTVSENQPGKKTSFYLIIMQGQETSNDESL